MALLQGWRARTGACSPALRVPAGETLGSHSGDRPNANAPSSVACSGRHLERAPEQEEREMIVAGQTVENPQTGERLVFHKTARDTGGECTEFTAHIAPGGHLPAPHVHPGQSERFAI